MNYRHAFHAGNRADCAKHALLVLLLDHLLKKPAPFAVLDTHAGCGRTDLRAGPAARTGEWRAGIGRLLDDPTPAALARYVGLVRSLGLYPGSPAIIRALLRPDDRLVCCELHPDDAATLRRHFAHDRLVAVHARDGHQAVRALLPPAARRGLVLLDPPFETPDEFARLAETLLVARRRFAAGVLAAWYPIKGRAGSRAFADAIRAGGLRDVLAAEITWREPVDAARLNGCGLLVAKPPWTFAAEAEAILLALLGRFDVEPGAGATVARLVDE